MPEPSVTRDQICSDALNILKCLRENVRAARSNKLADVKGAFEDNVSIEFDTYFFFLRKFHYIGMDREACLQLTPEGEKVVDGEKRDRFDEAVGEYFANRLAPASSGPAEPEVEAPEVPMEATHVLESVWAVNQAGSGDETSVGRAPVAPPPASAPAPSAAKPTYERPRPAPPPSLARPVVLRDPEPRMERMELKGQDFEQRYVKYDPVGQGPLGTVYRGRHSALGLDVAIKELKDIFAYFSFLQRSDVLKRLKREICAQAVVRHPSVVAVLDQGTDVARPYFVTELCTANLRSRLDAAGGKGLVPLDAIRVFLQLAYGLKAAHAQGLIHGNLKPENVLFDKLGNAQLSDFGLSRIIEVDPTKGMPQVFVGTGGMGYMSPEQLGRTSKELGPSSDVYGLGILLYEMLTGQIPGRRSPLPSALNAEAPAKLDSLFDKMTQDRLEGRYPDFEAVLGDFYAAFEDGSVLKRGDLILCAEPQPAPTKAEAGNGAVEADLKAP